jgi:hypothetical protein
MNSESQKIINYKKLTEKVEIPESVDIRRDFEDLRTRCESCDEVEW